MIAMRYGCVPIVHRTGGLADTVTEFDATTETGNGFSFEEQNAFHFLAAIVRGLEMYKRPEQWRDVDAERDERRPLVGRLRRAVRRALSSRAGTSAAHGGTFRWATRARQMSQPERDEARRITDLPRLIAALPDHDRSLVERLFAVEAAEGEIVPPPEMEPWLVSTFGSVEATLRQRVVRVMNRWTFEGATFNPLRAHRPISRCRVRIRGERSPAHRRRRAATTSAIPSGARRRRSSGACVSGG